MIYNQKQRQLIIWEQRQPRDVYASGFLLFNLGLRILGRNITRRFKHAFAFQAMDVFYKNEPVVNN